MCLCGSGGGGSGGGDVDVSDGGGGVDGSSRNNGVGDSGESIVHRNNGGVVVVLCIEAVEVDCIGVVDILVLGEVSMVGVIEVVELVVRVVVGCVVRLVLWCVNCQWEGIFFGRLYPEIDGNERTECGWVSLWDGDLGRLFCSFGTWFLEQDGKCRRADGGGRPGCCGGGCGCGASRVFLSFSDVAALGI